MPRRREPPRLYLRKGRIDGRTGRRLPDVWFIKDGPRELGTGCGVESLHGPDGAEQKLADYIAGKLAQAGAQAAAEHAADAGRPRDPSEVLVADVLALYAAEKGAAATDPGAVAARLKALLAWWAARTLAEVNRTNCKAYVAHRVQQPIAMARDASAARRVSDQAARRELEDLSAAIGYWIGEHALTVRPKVWLPDKAESPRDALERHQAARLLRAARGHRWDPIAGRWTRLQGSSRANRRHLTRFILIGLYTGSRPGVTPQLLWEEAARQAWVDLDAGTIWRRGKREKDHKTKRRPMVRIPARLLAHMRRWRAADLKLEAERQKQDPDFRLTSVIHHGGRPLAGRVRTGFEGCVRDAGLDPDITPHWLRHTCATWLLRRDVSSWDAAAYTGMTMKTLEDNYGHHRPSHHSAARRALGGAAGR